MLKVPHPQEEFVHHAVPVCVPVFNTAVCGSTAPSPCALKAYASKINVDVSQLSHAYSRKEEEEEEECFSGKEKDLLKDVFWQLSPC